MNKETDRQSQRQRGSHNICINGNNNTIGKADTDYIYKVLESYQRDISRLIDIIATMVQRNGTQ